MPDRAFYNVNMRKFVEFSNANIAVCAILGDTKLAQKYFQFLQCSGMLPDDLVRPESLYLIFMSTQLRISVRIRTEYSTYKIYCIKKEEQVENKANSETYKIHSKGSNFRMRKMRQKSAIWTILQHIVVITFCTAGLETSLKIFMIFLYGIVIMRLLDR
ncbi:hypothetical protein ECANGB1_1130 [Enterospora canceri]|uniref:Uncharacterized protein n=1 Tax=Enterospora canceri TaxID=1081671 RepID=A0A1Y1S6N4_9MICR|nr:hypothetical protein ECANGB1_1130 [Enterospora canceri]